MKTNKAFNNELRQLLVTENNWTIRNDFSTSGQVLISPCKRVGLLLSEDSEKGSVIGCCGRYYLDGLQVVECLPCNAGTFSFGNGNKVNLLGWSEVQAINEVMNFIEWVGVKAV